MSELISFISKDIPLFLVRFIFDVSVLVSIGPFIFSWFQDHMIAASYVKNDVDLPKTINAAQPIVSLSLHVTAFITAGVIFATQNVPLALGVYWARNDVAKMSSPTVMWVFIAMVSVAIVWWLKVVASGCHVTTEDVHAYIKSGSDKKPPDVSLTKYRLWLVIGSLMVNPLSQFVSYKLG